MDMSIKLGHPSFQNDLKRQCVTPGQIAFRLQKDIDPFTSATDWNICSALETHNNPYADERIGRTNPKAQTSHARTSSKPDTSAAFIDSQ
jgi:hypothetical protein